MLIKNTHNDRHILFWQHYFLHKGTFTRAFKIAEQLARPGLKIWVCGVDPTAKGFLPTLTPAESNSDVIIVRFPGPMGERNNPVQIARRILAGWIWTLFKAPRFEIGHFFALGHPFNAFTAPLLAWLKCKRRFVDWDDLWGGGFASFMGKGLNSFLTFCERKLPRLLRPEKVTTVSDYLAGQFVDMGFTSEKIHLIGNGFDSQYSGDPCAGEKTLKENLGLSENAILVISVGNTYSPGSLRHLLAAFDCASSQDGRLYLVLLGQFRKFGKLGRELDGVMKQFAPLMNRKVFELGAVPLAQMHHDLAGCDFVILPMEDHPIDKARFPIRLGDYLQHRKLIVSNAVGEVEKILSQSGLGMLSQADDQKSFSVNILQAALIGQNYGNINEKAFNQLLEEYSWKNLALRWSQLYI